MKLSKLDLSEEDHIKFLEICKKYNIKPMTTIFSYSNIDLVENLGLKNVKISSFDCASTGLLNEVKGHLTVLLFLLEQLLTEKLNKQVKY